MGFTAGFDIARRISDLASHKRGCGLGEKERASGTQVTHLWLMCLLLLYVEMQIVDTLGYRYVRMHINRYRQGI